MKDRSGFERCGGYKIEDYTVCPKCKGNVNSETLCKVCGGYGEVSKEPGDVRLENSCVIIDNIPKNGRTCEVKKCKT